MKFQLHLTKSFQGTEPISEWTDSDFNYQLINFGTEDWPAQEMSILKAYLRQTYTMKLFHCIPKKYVKSTCYRPCSKWSCQIFKDLRKTKISHCLQQHTSSKELCCRG